VIVSPHAPNKFWRFSLEEELGIYLVKSDLIYKIWKFGSKRRTDQIFDHGRVPRFRGEDLPESGAMRKW
jgi:hypothetical protein